jgi:chromosome partitioning protein
MEMEIQDSQITLEEVSQQAETAASMISKIRTHMLAPTARKRTPLFRADEVALMCGVSKSSFTHRLTSPSFKDMPSGTLNETGRKRLFTLPEARTWVKSYRKKSLRPQAAEAITISIANFKGGTTKTTTTMTLAQGLTLLGHRVLVIDADPQASLTTFFGILPDVEIGEEDTIFALIDGSQTSIRPLIRETYWDGLDLVPAASSLFGAEFLLPARQQEHKDFEFWSVLDLGIYDVKSDYDVIIIDTPPALSYVTINALMASNGIIMPLPPQTLDYASAGQFWSLFAELTGELLVDRGAVKKFDFINILLSRVEPTAAANMVREWITQTYGSKVLPLEIPRTATAALKSAEFGTVYDSEPADSKDRTFKRARDAYDLFVNHVDSSLRKAWDRQLATGGGTVPPPTATSGEGRGAKADVV